MQISPIQQNKQVNFTSSVFVKDCQEILANKNVRKQISRLEKNGVDDVIKLSGRQTLRGDGFINMNIYNYDSCEEREKDFFFKKGELKLGTFYKKLLKEEPKNIWRF